MATIDEAARLDESGSKLRPSIRIRGLHIRGLRSIRALDLPADGLGWAGREMPDVLILGGVNGSGKTTLLEFLVHVFECVRRRPGPGEEAVGPALRAEEAWVDIHFEIPTAMSQDVRFVIGDKKFFDEHADRPCFGYQRERGYYQRRFEKREYNRLHSWLYDERNFAATQIPSVVYMPSEGRALVLPQTEHKIPGLNLSPPKFISWWKRPSKWEESFEASLYTARWLDLNSKEEHEAEETHHFEAYSRAFERFSEGRKRLRWVQGQLVVELKNGVRHDLSQLSSGEKQMITIMGELWNRWRPGSLVLIDEPELHLHSSWQGLLLDVLTEWRNERGGQVILATQSSDLFGYGDIGTKVLLGGVRLA